MQNTLIFVLAIHYFACGWLMIYMIKERGNWPHTPFVHEDDNLSHYFEALYLITTTISTVGYGDYKGFNDTSGLWAAEMAYLYFVTLFGLILFSVVLNEIFEYKTIDSVLHIVKKTTQEMEWYLYSVSRVVKTRSMTKEMVDECIDQMEQTIRHSTRSYFHGKKFRKFYDELPNQLKIKLVKTAL